MSKNKHRTGIFDLEDVNVIELSSSNKAEIESQAIIEVLRLLVDATDIKTDNDKIIISKALLIVKEQLKISGIREVSNKKEG